MCQHLYYANKNARLQYTPFQETVVSSFFRKSKKVMWKLVLQNDKFPEALSELGRFNLVTDEVSNSLD